MSPIIDARARRLRPFWRLARGRRLAAGLSALALLGSGCRSQPTQPTSVVVVVVDTLRADRLGRYGNGKGLTPFLDQLADRGVRFEHAYAPASWTMPSVASLLTSRYPAQHLVSDFDSRLSEREVTIAERLAGAGYANGGFSANFRLSEELGYAQGFPTWRRFVDSPGSKTKPRGEVVRAAALAWLDAAAQGGAGQGGAGPAPRLLYLQYMEPHAPYEPPAELRTRFAPGVSAEEAVRLNNRAQSSMVLDQDELGHLAALYDAEVAAADAELRRLFEALEQRRLLTGALLIVTADHGEEFLEHGAMGHGTNLFNDTVRVPLIVVGPTVTPGRVVRDNVSLVDLAPTILDVLGLAPEARFEGHSLAPLLRGGSAAAADVILQLPRGHFEEDLREHTEGLVRGTDKLLVDPGGAATLFDLGTDPGERVPQAPPATAALSAALATANAALATRQQAQAETAPVDEATKEKLRALGYDL